MSLYWVGTGVSWWEIVGRSGIAVSIIISITSSVIIAIVITITVVIVIAVTTVIAVIVVIVAILIICFYISKRVYIVLSGFGCE